MLLEKPKKYFNKQVLNSNNRMKTICDITKLVTGKLTTNYVFQGLVINKNIISNNQDIADSLNNYFLPIAENNSNSICKGNNHPLDYIQQVFHYPFPCIKYATTSKRDY
jgi:hypothetical protein